MRSVDSRASFYIGRHTFRDDTASLAINNVRNEQRMQEQLDRGQRRDERRETRIAVRERQFAELDPAQQRVIELQRSLQGLGFQKSAGEIGRQRFNALARPLRSELKQLSRP